MIQNKFAIEHNGQYKNKKKKYLLKKNTHTHIPIRNWICKEKTNKKVRALWSSSLK